MTLLSLASKQIWPQVLVVAHLKPERLVLLHSEDVSESKGPAQRLKRFFDKSGLVPKGGTQLEEVSDSDFDAVERRLDEVRACRGLSAADCALNFTGGNKLMATAAFRWAARRDIRSFYLERRNRITWFEPRNGEVTTSTESLDPHLTDSLDPVALLRCQLEASEVERAGQSVTLNREGAAISQKELFHRLYNGGNPLSWLQLSGDADRETKEGDRLELMTAAVLLKLGVPLIQRSLRLKVKSVPHVSTRKPHAEIDLLFTWAGRLWLVDCKDRKPTENLVAGLREHLPGGVAARTKDLLDQIENRLSIGQTKALKEDLLAVREVGGLLGRVVCVRKAELPDEVAQYAKHYGIALVRKDRLGEGFSGLLFPDRPAERDELVALARGFEPK